MLKRLWMAGLLVTTLGVVPCTAQAPAPLVPVTAPQAARQQHQKWEQVVGLTPDQMAQIKPLKKQFKQQKKAAKQQFRSGLTSILTADQQSQLQQLESQSGKHLKLKVWEASLGVTRQQKGQIKALKRQQRAQQRQAREAFFNQVQPLLTADQQSRLAAFRQNQGHRGLKG